MLLILRRAEKPTALEVVQRYKANSKFFRSLLVVLSIIIVWELGPLIVPWATGQIKSFEEIESGRPALGLFSLFLLPFSFLRYANQREKAMTPAYWYIITLEAGKVVEVQELYSLRTMKLPMRAV